jgi:hypothetical protein
MKVWNYFRKHHLFFFLPLLVLTAIIGPTNLRLFRFTFVAIYSFSYYIDLRRYRTNIAERKMLARKGLTYWQWRDLNFVKRWTATRTAGIVKYVFVFGGLYLGFGLCFVFGLLFIAYVKGAIAYISESFTNMLTLTTASYVAGFFVADVLYLILWTINERRSARLFPQTH